MKRVGLIGSPELAEIQRLAMRLEERGAEGVALDSGMDPAIVVSAEGESACGVDLGGFEGFYVADLGIRPPLVRGEDGAVDAAASADAGAASRRHLASWNTLLERLLSRCRVVNPPRTHDLHTLKPWEMTVYWREDVPSPWTLATSDPAGLLGLREEPVAEWIRKGMVGGYGYTEAFVFPVSESAAAEAMAGGPCMIQERVQGDNVRAYVLGGKVIGAAEIVPVEGGETDSRRGDIRVRRMEIPEDAARHAVRAAARWGLQFAAVDFMVDARSGRYALLECNSAPFFLSFEQQTGWDVSSRLADYLLGRMR
jgi:glutathione synthase/RimK-type ligase-like ATP-grasp enzyme